MSYKLETTALISKENYNAFRIRCIMLILEKLIKMMLITSNNPSFKIINIFALIKNFEKI